VTSGVISGSGSGFGSGAGGAVFGAMSTSVTTSGSGGTGGSLNPDDCEVDRRYEGNDWCEIRYECGGRWVWAYCDSYNSDSWNCGCDTNNFYGNYSLTGVDDDDACPLAASLCMDPDQVEFTDPPVCEPVYQVQQSNYCSMEVECTQSEQIDENITAERREWEWVYCYGSGNDFVCECQSGDGWISLTIEDIDNASSLCPDVLDVCHSGIEGAGPRTCEPRSQFAQQGNCSAEQQCTQQANLDGSSVLVNSYISTDCREVDEDEWDCNCQLSPGSTSFTITSSDGWAACSEASEACALAAGVE
jgi:hypothetical protein